jgi:hypothetical protein
MDIWLRMLLDPGSILSARPQTSPTRMGLARLLNGQFLDYVRSSDELNLPSLVGPPQPPSRGDRALLTALVANLKGEPVALEYYQNLLGTWTTHDGRRSLASVLASMHAADGGNSLVAVEFLRDAVGPSEIWSATLDLHLGVRLVELGDFESALDSTIRASDTINRFGPNSLITRYLGWIAASNRFHFSLLAGQNPSWERFAGQESPCVGEVQDLVRQGLAAYFEGNYLESYRDLRVQGFRYSAEDPVSSKLDAARLRAECIADWQLVGQVRKWSGRWQLLNALGRNDENPELGIELLRRGHDDEGLEVGLQYALQVGPLRALRNSGVELAERAWANIDLQSNLVELRGCAEVMPAPSADKAIIRLVDGWADLSRPSATAYMAHHVVDTIAALLVAASDSLHDSVARAFLLLSDRPNALELNAIGRALHVIDWPVVSAKVRSAWLEFAQRHLGETTDAGTVALEAAMTMARMDEEQWTPLVATRYSESRLPILGAMLFGFEHPMDQELLGQLTDQTVASVTEMVVSARQGTHGMGARLQAPVLLCQLHFQNPEIVAWSSITEFLYEGAISIDNKIPLIEALAQSGEQLSSEEKSDLKSNIGQVSQAVTPFSERLGALDAAVLRLRLSLDMVEEEELLSHLLRWSHSSIPELRLEAAKTGLAISDSATSDAIVVILVGLTSDSNPSVRLQAAFTLGSRPWRVSPSVETFTRNRLLEIMSETDSRGPIAVIQALRFQVREGRAVPPEFVNHVDQLARQHISALVRSAARELSIGMTD